MSTPQNVAFLERAIRKMVSSNLEHNQLRVMMADAIVGQFVTDGVLRGGTSLKFRYGLKTTRFTMDFDVARKVDQDAFERGMARRMESGWAGFTGTIETLDKASPQGVPEAYVMQPYRIRLNYKDHPWCSVRLEVSYDELGDAEQSDFCKVPDEVCRAFEQLGFPVPTGLPLMTVSHQIAQKFHGVTDPSARRVQDLVDLQLLFKNETVDLAEVNGICVRLFSNRKRQPWPSHVAGGDAWRDAYSHAAMGIDVAGSLEEAIAFVNAKIDLVYGGTSEGFK